MELKPQRKTLRSHRPLILRLLVTAAGTGLVLGGGLYGLIKGSEARRRPAPPPVPEVRESPALPKPRLPSSGRRKPARKSGPDSMAMVKMGEERTVIPRMSGFSSSYQGGRTRFRAPVAEGGGGDAGSASYDTPAPISYASGEGMLLKPSGPGKTVKIAGAKPVSEAMERRYAGKDPESEMRQARERAKAEEAEAAAKRLLRDQLKLSAILMVIGLLVMIFGSRILRALRLLDEPEGTHWTLK